MLGYTSEHLLKSKLHELMPEPTAQLHQRWMKGRGELCGVLQCGLCCKLHCCYTYR